MKKICGLFSALALAAFAVPFIATAQGMPTTPGASPAPSAGRALDLKKADARMVSVQFERRMLMGTSQIVDMGPGPVMAAQFQSDGRTATITVQGTDLRTGQMPLFDKLTVGPASAAITGARIVMSSPLTIKIDVQSGATDLERRAMGMAMVTVSLGANPIVNNRALQFGVVARASTARGPLAIATTVAANPTGGAPALINGAACAPAGGGFLMDAMMFGVLSCDSQITISGQRRAQFINQMPITPKPFDPATGRVEAVGTEVFDLGNVLGIDLPDAMRFTRDFSGIVIQERN